MVGEPLPVRAPRVTVAISRAASATADAQPAPTLRHQIANFVLLQAGWFAVVLGAAHGFVAWGVAAAVAIVAWHLAIVSRPGAELRLVLGVLGVGLMFEAVTLQLGHVRYPTGESAGGPPPYWLIALWGLFGIALNVSMRWMKGRWVVAALLGAVVGPLSYVSGVKLGAAEFIHRTPALVVLSIGWAIAMPVLIGLAARFDGVSVPERGIQRG